MEMKKIFVIGLICIMAVTMLTACNNNGNNGSNGGVDPDIDTSNLNAMEIVEKSAEAMENVSSFASTMQSAMTLGFLGETLSMSISAEMIVNADPMRMSVTTLMEDPMTGETMDIIIYVIHEDDYLVTYMNLPEMGWVKQTQPFSQELLDKMIQMQSPHETMSSARILGEETVNGVRSWHVEVTMSGEAMFEFVQAMQEDFLGVFDEAAFAAMGDMTLEMWIAQDTFYQVRMVIDMTEMMDEMMGDMGVDVKRMIMALDFFSFGTAPIVTLPEEAADAVEAAINL